MKIIGLIHKRHKVSGFTITEVIVASVIFTLAMAGILTSISHLRQPAVESSQEVTAAFLGKKILDDLRTQVSAQTWETNSLLSLGTHTNTVTVSGIAYNISYLVEPDDLSGTGARKVTLNVTW